MSECVRPVNMRFVVAAIDFGTTYSGYAYSFNSEMKKDPLKMYANNAWISDGVGLITLKTPTTVLFTEQGMFHSFGFEAESKYADLALSDEHTGWRYFSRFKMELNSKLNIRRQLKLTDDQGRKMLAKDVFAASIRYLKEHMIEQIRLRDSTIEDTNFLYLLTVPAIWHDGAKQFMKEAAFDAGIPRDQLMLALEPECAAIYCKELANIRAIDDADEEENPHYFNPGAHFMVMDLGGGTIDITVQVIQEDYTLSGVCPASGGPWGGTLVDTAFMCFLNDIFTVDVMNKFQEDKLESLELQRTFESQKRNVKYCTNEQNDSMVILKLPIFLLEQKGENGDTLNDILKRSSYGKSVLLKKGRLYIELAIFLDMFKQSQDNLVTHVKTMFENSELQHVSTILMVGGFAESQVMNATIKAAFPEKNIIVPHDAGLSVLKGAVMFGFDPATIRARKLAYTYGISCSKPFDETRHPINHRHKRNGILRCEDIFKVLITAGSTVYPGTTSAEHVFNARWCPQDSAVIEIYKTPEKEPEFIDDEGCQQVGKIHLELARKYQDDEDRQINVQLKFGDTELMVSAHEDGTDNKIEVHFDFLK